MTRPPDSAHPPIGYEVCVEDAAGARAAERGGATRVELCANLPEGGTTPSVGAMAATRAATRLPVTALVRPRAGDFVYDADECAAMRRDVVAARDAGLDGVALGVLAPEGGVDRDTMRELIELARPLQVTFHRAFDLLRAEDLEDVCALGCARVLTSGGAASALAGAALIHDLVERAAGRTTIVAAGSVRAAGVAELVRATGVREVHGSAMVERSGDSEPAGDVVLGGASGGGWRRRVTDEASVRDVISALRSLAPAD